MLYIYIYSYNYGMHSLTYYASPSTPFATVLAPRPPLSPHQLSSRLYVPLPTATLSVPALSFTHAPVTPATPGT